MKDLKVINKKWDDIITAQSELLKNQLDENEISALSSCIGDCYQSFQEIYFVLFAKLETIHSRDYDSVHDCVVDMYWQFDHIKNHVLDAEKGFSVLLNLLAKKVESKAK